VRRRRFGIWDGNIVVVDVDAVVALVHFDDMVGSRKQIDVVKTSQPNDDGIFRWNGDNNDNDVVVVVFIDDSRDGNVAMDGVGVNDDTVDDWTQQ
jgi:hypothetical protein